MNPRQAFLLLVLLIPSALIIQASEIEGKREIEIFEPSKEWKEVESHQHLPGGLEIHMDLSTGKKYARELPPRSAEYLPPAKPADRSVALDGSIDTTAGDVSSSASLSDESVHTIVVGDETVVLKKGEKATISLGEALSEKETRGPVMQVPSNNERTAQGAFEKEDGKKRQPSRQDRKVAGEKLVEEARKKSFDDVQNINDLLVWAVENSDSDVLKKIGSDNPGANSENGKNTVLDGYTLDELRQRVQEYGSDLMKQIFPYILRTKIISRVDVVGRFFPRCP
mmetsp:Transcript_15635/g.39673  ORF Transcript_15635/g.39673 Transcript_15635/m.39673 type:complete len:282 (-) Transcript_15635:777-1622(-)